MPVVNTLEAMGDGISITEDQLHQFLNKITLKIYNILHGDGYLGAVDYEEFGDTGHRVMFSNSLRELREQHAYFSSLLANPELRGDFGYFVSQNVPIHTVTSDDDANRIS